jgi:SMODS-associating 2TM, beta-strand rich effector domain
MKNIKAEALLWVQLGSFIAIWALILYLTKTRLAINLEAIQKLPDVITVYVILSFVFAKWLWRWPIFRGWLVPLPDLQGTWAGQIDSNWKDPTTGYHIEAVPIMLVIRQTFLTISCALFTKESESYSTVAQISVEEDSDTFYLRYNYTNRPKATMRERSMIHDGAVRLRIISVPERLLEGEFWTSRCTAGDLSLKFVSRELLEKFTVSEPK